MNMYSKAMSVCVLPAVFVFASCTNDSPRKPDDRCESNCEDAGARPSIEYNQLQIQCAVEQPCSMNAPLNRGSAATFRIEPSLPEGMKFDKALGSISGSPKSPMPMKLFTITATNSAGTSSTNLRLSVHPVDIPPDELSYASNPAVYRLGQPVTANRPTFTGGWPTKYSVSPDLPAGLSLNSKSGIVSGTPSVVTQPSSFAITASNSKGNVTEELNIAIVAVAPEKLSYSNTTAVYTLGTNVTPNVPSSSGGAITHYAVQPALPTGLTLHSTSGIITGTPTEIAAPTTYTITGGNSGGTTTTDVSIEVIDIPPTNLHYTINPVVFVKNSPIVPIAPSNNGGKATNYVAVPKLPDGLQLDNTTGVISGTPSNASPVGEYTITASNSGGKSSITLTIEVREVSSAGLSYPELASSFHIHTPITPSAPSTTGATPTNFVVHPALPEGLMLSNVSGIISGTPTIAVSKGSYTITASTDKGEVSVVIEIEVTDDPPDNLTYDTPAVSYRRGTEINPLHPSSKGGSITSYEISPALPSGLSFDAETGVISGTPTAVTEEATYTVIASNATGSASFELSITVIDMAPAGLKFVMERVSYNVGVAVEEFPPSAIGGKIISYEISPRLPEGLAIHSGTGVISGTPRTESPLTTYTVTAANYTDSTTTTIQIEVLPRIPGIYLNGNLIHDKRLSFTYDETINFDQDHSTILVVGDGDYILKGAITGPGKGTLSGGPNNTIYLEGPQLHGGLDVESAHVDAMALKWEFGILTRSGSGSIKRYATPKELASELRAWFDASATRTLFQNFDTQTIVTKDGDPVRTWGNLANPALSAGHTFGTPTWNKRVDAVTISRAGYVLGDLMITRGATVIAVVTTTGLSGVVPAIFTAAHPGGYGGNTITAFLGADPHRRNPNATITAAYYRGSTNWVITDPIPVKLDEKNMFGMTSGSTGTVLQVAGSTVSINPVRLSEFPETYHYVIARSWNSLEFWNGHYFELVVANGIESLENLTGYMAWHNNLNDTLPENHRFKNAAPWVLITAEGIAVH